MIFYFTGTGNSLYVAKKLADKFSTNIVDMSKITDDTYVIDLKENDTIGFVFPVYFYSVNTIVLDFIEKLKINYIGDSKSKAGIDIKDVYTYAVVTCGASIGGCGSLLKEKLAKKGIELNAVYPLVMPDNAMIYYNIATKEENDKKLELAESDIVKVISSIEAKEKTKFGGTFISKLMLFVYKHSLSTRKFKVEDKCVSCGKCSNNCPQNVIKMVDGKPVWDKDKCVKCLACINRCPVTAIQYGRMTKKRNRYENKKVF